MNTANPSPAVSTLASISGFSLTSGSRFSDPNLDPNPSLNRLSPRELGIHTRATSASRRFREAEAELLEALIAVQNSKLFSKMGYPSLFRYANEELKLSEAVAYCAISVARKAAEVPALREAIRDGKLGLSKAKKVLSVLSPRISLSEQKAWVEKAIALTSRKLERAVASINPESEISERARYKSARRIELTLGIDEEVLLDFRRAQDLVSEKRAGPANLEKTLAEVVRFYLERNDPERRAKRVVAKKGMPVVKEAVKIPMTVTAKESVEGKEQFTGTVSPAGTARDYSRAVIKRIPVPAMLAHRVRLRDRNTCQALMPNGNHCGSRRWVEIHHRVPVSQAGANTIENLLLFCRAHHQAHHGAERRTHHSGRSQNDRPGDSEGSILPNSE